MTALGLGEIEDKLRNSDPQKRQSTLRALTDLFLSAAPSLDEEGVEVFDNVFEIALATPDLAALTDISARMAPVPNAPARLIRRLANDSEILVAGPVLGQSPRLSEADLCEIACATSNAHLLAISTRQSLVSPVTDILIDRGDDEVARNVACNETAKLSERGISRLLERAKSDETIGAGLYMRQDLPPNEIKTALARAEARSEDAKAKIAAAQRLVITLQQAGELTEAKICAFATEKKYDEFIAAISFMSKLRHQYLESMMQGQRLGGLTFVCKSLGFSMTTMNALWRLAASRNDVTTEEISTARKGYLSVSREIAERVVRFWLIRQSASAV